MVETGGLENRFGRESNGGSNPSPSATCIQLIWREFMDNPRAPQPILDRYWQPLLIVLGSIGVLILALYDPRR